VSAHQHRRRRVTEAPSQPDCGCRKTPSPSATWAIVADQAAGAIPSQNPDVCIQKGRSSRPRPAARNGEPVRQELPEYPAMRHGLAPLPPSRPGYRRYAKSTSLPYLVRGQSEVVLPGQIRALPAGITNRVGRFRRTPRAADMCCVTGAYTSTGRGPDVLDHSGLDLYASMFAPCSLGRPGTPRQHAVFAAHRECKPPHRMAGPGRVRPPVSIIQISEPPRLCAQRHRVQVVRNHVEHRTLAG
jgi:hypothetical protein